MASFDNVVTPFLLPKAFYKETPSELNTERTDARSSIAFGWVPSYPYFRNVSLKVKALSNDSSVAADACTALPDDTTDLSGYAFLIRLGGCAANVKAEHAMAFNANYLVFYADNTSGYVDIVLRTN